MKRAFAWLMVGLVGITSAGCSRVQTKIVQKPRVDQEMTPGQNRGYLKGSGPATGERRKTRDMVETNVELPTWDEMRPWRKGQKEEAPAAEQQQQAIPAMPEAEFQQESEQPREFIEQSERVQAPEVSLPAEGTQYKVEKGDTLQKISRKFYGTTQNWYKLYKANKDVLKSPDRIRPGQMLTIPSFAKTASAASEDSSNEYK